MKEIMKMDSNIIKAKSRLPIDFINELYKEYGQKNADKILKGMCQERNTTFRVNTLKSSANEIKDELNKNKIEYEIATFYDNAFIIKNENENDLRKLNIYKDGKIYLQSLSSIIPPLILELDESGNEVNANAKSNESILDMAAAPRK